MLVHGVKGGVWEHGTGQHPQQCQHHFQDADDAGETIPLGGGGLVCSRRPSSPAPPPQWYRGGGPWPRGGGGVVGRLAPVRATLWARLRRCSCDALQCDLLILQHATSCSAVAIDSARCHDAVCGLQRHNQVPTKCAATRQWQTHFTCYPSGRCGNHGRGGLCGHTEPPFSPPPIPTGGRGGVGTMDPPTHPTGGRGACRVTLCYLPD